MSVILFSPSIYNALTTLQLSWLLFLLIFPSCTFWPQYTTITADYLQFLQSINIICITENVTDCFLQSHNLYPFSCLKLIILSIIMLIILCKFYLHYSQAIYLMSLFETGGVFLLFKMFKVISMSSLKMFVFSSLYNL